MISRKRDLAKEIQKQSNGDIDSIAKAERIIDVIASIIIKELDTTGRIPFGKLGSFKKKELAPLDMIMGVTGERIKVPARNSISFIPTKSAKKYLNS